MLLFELQFSGVFDGYDALRVRDVTGKDIENRRLASARSSGDDDVQATLDYGREQFQHGLGEGLVFEHVARGDRIAAKAADREAGSVERQGRDDGVDARAILQAGVDHRGRLIDSPPDAGHDAVDDLH